MSRKNKIRRSRRRVQKGGLSRSKRGFLRRVQKGGISIRQRIKGMKNIKRQRGLGFFDELRP